MTAALAFDDILKGLAAEFIGIGTDSVLQAEKIVAAVQSGGREAPDAIREIARIAHSLKGQGGSFGYTNLTLVAHRLEDFLIHAGPGRADFWPGVLRYLDRMARILDGELPADRDSNAVLGDLPVAALFDGVLERQDIEVVLASEGATQNRVIRKELEACGFRVTVIPSSVEALSYVVRVKPRLLLASAVLPGISGVDLIRAVKAMTTTRGVACILTTSTQNADKSTTDLPKDVPIVRKGASFASDVAAALERVGLV